MKPRPTIDSNDSLCKQNIKYSILDNDDTRCARVAADKCSTDIVTSFSDKSIGMVQGAKYQVQ